VTGAAGFIGGRLVNRLAAEACRIIRVARTAPPSIDVPLAAEVIDVVGDVCDRATWDQVADAHVVLHLAAQTSGAVAAGDAAADFHANVTPMRHLLAACRQRRVHPIIVFAGTVTEAGIPSRLPVTEDETDDPITTYDRHKLMAEDDLKAAASHGNVCGATLRLSNVYGPGVRGVRQDRDILNRMIAAAMQGQPLTVYGTGEYVRDYVFIEDVVDAFLMAAAHPDPINGRHFIVGSGRGVSIREAFELVAARVEARTGRRVPVITADPPGGLSDIERRHFVADPSHFSAATGWRAEWSLADGIDRTIEAFS
jgi:nucleoside-diphosphate-sugar epimerase